jgi:general stress protein 26
MQSQGDYMPQSQAIARLNVLTRSMDTVILTTLRPDGTLHSCPMASQGVTDDGAFWFIANSNSEKVEAVRTIQRVSLCFANHVDNHYVSVSGFCELVRNREAARQLWNPNFKSWFPGGLEDPDLVLMKIVVQEAEYWDASQSRMVPLLGFDPNAIT